MTSRIRLSAPSNHVGEIVEDVCKIVRRRPLESLRIRKELETVPRAFYSVSHKFDDFSSETFAQLSMGDEHLMGGSKVNHRRWWRGFHRIVGRRGRTNEDGEPDGSP